jgi:hypothetical protein
MNKQKGYIALFSTIILSAVFLLLFIGMFSLAMGGINRTTDEEKSIQALLLANTCAEKALSEIRKDTEYFIGETEAETVLFGDDNCKIESVTKLTNDIRLLLVSGTFSDYKKEAEITIFINEIGRERTLEIINWKEDL